MVFLSSLLALWAFALATSASATVLHTSSRWILDASNARVKLRCVNWAGHLEVGIPEGLQMQPVATIASWVSSNGFNCVRLTYSIDMALNPNRTVSASFSAAASLTGVPAASMTSLYNSVVSKNSWISSSTQIGAFARVIDELGSRNVMVILDNQISKAGWCCSTTDGNGWWDQASGYVASNSQYFSTNNWLAGLRVMATFAKSHSNVVGMSLRNELRAVGSQDQNSHADWYKFVAQGANAVHSTNGDLIIPVGGPSYATDLSFLYSKPFDRSAYGNKIFWEAHNYQWTYGTTNCTDYQTRLGNAFGYLISQNQAYTGPLWLSEFGWSQSNPSSDEVAYYTCLMKYMQNNDADWAYWALMGSYYVRSGEVNSDEGFGLLKTDWSGWRNPNFRTIVGSMLQVSQGP